MLTSRQGSQAPGADVLRDELARLGATVTLTACDVGDRDQLAEALAAIPGPHPLTGVVHCAGVLDDGMVDAMTPERLARVLGPKAYAAVHLHELTQDADLALFVMFSSIVGVHGNPSQSNYAAASSFLDALAQHRRARGLPGQSLAWGMWEQTSTLTGKLDEGSRQRIRQAGMLPLPTERALALFDRAHTLGDALLVPMRQPVTFGRPAAGRTRARRTAESASGTGGPSLAERIAALPEVERDGYVVDAVCAHVAAVLGYGTADEIGPDRTFKELGFDSLTAVELRNRLSAATGLRLPATLAFDFPNPTALARHLREQIGVPATADPQPQASAPPERTETRVRELLAAIPLQRLEQSGLLDALVRLGEGSSAEPGAENGPERSDPAPAAAADGAAARIASMGLEELVDMALGHGGS